MWKKVVIALVFAFCFVGCGSDGDEGQEETAICKELGNIKCNCSSYPLGKAYEDVCKSNQGIYSKGKGVVCPSGAYGFCKVPLSPSDMYFYPGGKDCAPSAADAATFCAKMGGAWTPK